MIVLFIPVLVICLFAAFVVILYLNELQSERYLTRRILKERRLKVIRHFILTWQRGIKDLASAMKRLTPAAKQASESFKSFTQTWYDLKRN